MFDTSAVDEFEETLSFRKDTTGVDNTIFISAHAGNAARGPRVKVAIDPPDSLDPRGNIATVILDGTVIGEIDPQLLQQVQRFVQTNLKCCWITGSTASIPNNCNNECNQYESHLEFDEGLLK